MICKNCGIEISDDSKFCVGCGIAIEQPVEKAEPAADRNRYRKVQKRPVCHPAQAGAAPADRPHPDPLRQGHLHQPGRGAAQSPGGGYAHHRQEDPLLLPQRPELANPPAHGHQVNPSGRQFHAVGI